jgi:hypothetical protein
VPERTLVERVSEAIVFRSRLCGGVGALAGDKAAERIGDELAYDAALVRLCQHLAIPHDFLGWTARRDSPSGRGATGRTSAVDRSSAGPARGHRETFLTLDGWQPVPRYHRRVGIASARRNAFDLC